MKYFFEDADTSALSSLFKRVYPDRLTQKGGSIEFTSGCGNLIIAVKNYLAHSDEKLYATVDLVPDNLCLIKNFKKLWLLQLANPGRLWVIPIPCSEYYLLQSLVGTPLVLKPQLVEFCLHTRCHLIDNKWVDPQGIFHGTFEQYCKHVVKWGLIGCFENLDRKRQMSYYNYNCPCNHTYNSRICIQRDLMDKSISYVEEYPMFPAGSLLLGTKSVTVEEYREYLKKFIQRHNECVNEHIKIFPEKSCEMQEHILHIDTQRVI